MARPRKEGLDYFTLDTDFMDNRKVRRLIRACGPGSILILVKLLCNIYGKHGYYILWDDDMPFDIADQLVGVSEGAVSELVNKATQIGFFDQRLFTQYKVLTSREIQVRFLAATQKRIRVGIPDKWNLYSGFGRVSASETPVSGEETEFLTPESTQSKVKKSKEEKRKIFDDFRKKYPGTKGGLNREFDNFQKKYRNWSDILPLLTPALEKQIAWRAQAETFGEFIPPWKHLKTWLNQGDWELELPQLSKQSQKDGSQDLSNRSAYSAHHQTRANG